MFPQAKRIELKHPPLDLVVCQVRFPIVLKLKVEQGPVDFQTKIMSQYPLTNRKSRTLLETQPQEKRIMAKEESYWTFMDREERWTIAISDSFFSLETKKYRNFDEFLEKFTHAFDVVQQLYGIPLCSRIGLRYINKISKKTNPKLPENWPREIRAGLVPFSGIAGPEVPRMAQSENRLKLNDCFLTIRSVLIAKGFPGAENHELVLDFDCYSEEKCDFDKQAEILRKFKTTCYNAFRWSTKGLFEHYEQV